MPLNSTDKVESKNHINEFFLQGFTRWYNTLFTVDKTNILLQDYSRSCTAPYSLPSCKYCTNSQLEKFIQNEGFVYYSANDHNVNAKFVYDLFRYTYGTQEYLSSIARYVSNNPDVDAEILYDGYDTYEYGIRLYGDILGACVAQSQLLAGLGHNTGVLHIIVDSFVGLHLSLWREYSRSSALHRI